jgi:hypothetical protein
VIKVDPASPRIAPPAGTQAAVAQPVPVGSVHAVEAVRDAATGQMLLLFAGRRWPLKSGGAAPDLQPGARVLARVVQAEPDLELAIAGRTAEVTAALRREMPRQASPMRLLANLAWLVARPETRAGLPEAARAAIESAWRSIPEQGQLVTGEGLARAVGESGVRLEQLLAGGCTDATGLSKDWKATLARLDDVLGRAAGGHHATARTDADRAALPSQHGTLNALPPEPATLAVADEPRKVLGELAQQAREAFARVTCNQLASLDDARSLPMLFEVPYRSPDRAGVLRLRFDRETAAAHAAGPVWTLEFALDLGPRGPLRGRATLADGRVSVTLQPQSSSLAQAIDLHFDALRATLEQAGVPVGRLNCTRSDPVDTGRTGPWLVDVRA